MSNTSNNTSKSEESIKTFTVGVDTSIEDVVKYDSEKAKIVFDVEDPKGFINIPKKVLSDLSRQTREAYYMSKGLWETEHDEETGTVIHDFVVSPENVRLTMTAKTSVEVKPHLRKHFARPDKVSGYLMKGYKVADKNDLANPADDHALRVKLGGYDDVVLMVRDVETDKKYKKERDSHVTQMSQGASISDGAANITGQGMEIDKKGTYVSISEE